MDKEILERIEALERRVVALERRGRGCKTPALDGMAKEDLKARAKAIYHFGLKNLGKSFGNSAVRSDPTFKDISEGKVQTTLVALRRMDLLMCPFSKCLGRAAKYFAIEKEDADKTIDEYYNTRSNGDGDDADSGDGEDETLLLGMDA